jgi:deoxyribodipyrimidine photo-lyase
MSVFTPYHRRWDRQPLRDQVPAPRALRSPGVRIGRVPAADRVSSGRTSPDLPEGGEYAGRRRAAGWLRDGLAGYDDNHDPMATDGTSRLSPYLHLGCLSPLELVRRAAEGRSSGAAEFVRQLAWRDFHAQVLAARPDATSRDYRPRGDSWTDDPDEIRAWKEGRTGFPVVDAGMRQLRQEGWMHNRARLITGHFLVKTLNVDWRIGAQHFIDWLVDGDTASNTMNWQWVAGTGTISQFNRSYNMTTQARRHDPQGTYVRRYVPELADLDDAYVHEPWLLPREQLDRLGYPEPIVDQDEARERIRRARSTAGR